ncbi:hypothetical protein HJC23_005239 [Cyclotella cryptica]|uniref:Uncharacterized protein n=1 Tax=Cyclotella cryptica TaxID=29204 RepID=A0ABD3PQU9_9STRA
MLKLLNLVLALELSVQVLAAKESSQPLKSKGGSSNDHLQVLESGFAHGSLRASSTRTLDSLPCKSNQWHIDYKIMQGQGCSNSLDFPEVWREDPIMFHSSSEECCDFFYRGKPCTVNRVCEEAPSSSTSPTSKPSLKPTNQQQIQYYSIPSSGMCAPVDAFTPSWITLFFSDYTACCKSGWAVESCLAKAPPDETHTVPTTNPTVPPILYYAIPSTGMCTPVGAQTPSWMTTADFFSDYIECCESSWNIKPCIAAKPLDTLSPTSSPFSEPTSTPTSSPSSRTTSEPTFSPSREPTHQPSLNTTPEPTSEPTPLLATRKQSPTTGPTRTQATTELKPSCESSFWHPSEDFSKCTNSFGYTESWNIPPMRDTYLHTTLSGCCKLFFEAWGMECISEDICTMHADESPSVQLTHVPSSRPTNPPSSVELKSSCYSALWHPSEDYSKCSNSIGYPKSWDSLPLSTAFLHETADGCCDVFFRAWGNECIIEDMCQLESPEKPVQPLNVPPTNGSMISILDPTISLSCDSALWHPSNDYSQCTNR